MRKFSLCLGLGLMACGGDEAVEQPSLARQSVDENAIYGGAPDLQRRGVVLLLTESAEGTSLCSGTMIAKRVVLTAAHCLMSDAPRTLSCGEPLDSDAEQLKARSPRDIHVLVGRQPELDAKHAIARGQRILLPKTKTLCDHDIGFLILDRDAVPEAHVFEVRTDEAPALDERMTAVGYGRTEHDSVGERIERRDVEVLDVGPLPLGSPWLGNHELETSTGACSGDSGGPLLDAEERIVAVVSRGGDCRARGGHIYTRADGFVALMNAALGQAYP